MSMPGWLNDVSSVSNGDHATFNPSVDPNMAFMQTPTTATFDFNQVQNPQLQQRMQNGNVRNGSPGYLNPVYQTQSIIPSKRARPRDDMFSASPRQAPGALPSSRSQTPQQIPYANVNNNINGAAPMQAPTPYQHLQHTTSNNASPSPILQDQQHYAAPQRMQTASPSPFSPLGPNYGSQASPPQSDYGSRVDTPQNGGQQYAQAMPYGGTGTGPYFSPLSGPVNTINQSSGPTPYSQGIVSMQQQARYNDMRQNHLARQLNATNAAAQHRHQGSSFNPLANPNQLANFQTPGRAPPMQQPASRPGNPEQFVRLLVQFMQQHNLPLNTNPSIGGRSISLPQLYGVVMKHGGSKKVTMMNGWPAVAATLQFPPLQYPHAAQELQTYWQSNLIRYEQSWMQSMQQRHRALNNQLAVPHQNLGMDAAASLQDQFSPAKQIVSHHPDQSSTMHGRRASHVDYQTPLKQVTPQHQDLRQPQTNGFSTPQQAHMPNSQRLGYNMTQPTLSLPPQVIPQHPRQTNRSRAGSVAKKDMRADTVHANADHDSLSDSPRQAPIGTEYVAKYAELVNEKGDAGLQYGGIKVSPFAKNIDELVLYKINVPTISELGVVDIRALTMSLRSGIHSEVRLALDTVATLSYDPHPPLEQCEDLVETLIDCAEDQVEILAENAAEVSDVMLISPYEELVRGCRTEIETLQDIPEFGTLEYNLDRSVERLICITTILRNFSFYEINHPLLADPTVIKFMATVIRYLGTRNMLLRTHCNTLDFSKDVITYLSNVSPSIDLPGKEEASCMLHFLLSFAPSPPPTTSGVDGVMFSPFNPAIHRYLPSAVDSLAKLLARDDPNRALYKSIFAADGTSSPPFDLLTRTFALAIAPTPEPEPDKRKIQVVETRKPYLAQGMLAAEIIVTLVPGSEHGLARSWLNSQDAFAAKVLKLITLLNHESSQSMQRHPATGRVLDPDPQAYGMIARRAIAVLRRLAEKAKDVDVPSNRNPSGTGTMLDALMARDIDSNVVKQLCIFAELDT